MTHATDRHSLPLLCPSPLPPCPGLLNLRNQLSLMQQFISTAQQSFQLFGLTPHVQPGLEQQQQAMAEQKQHQHLHPHALVQIKQEQQVPRLLEPSHCSGDRPTGNSQQVSMPLQGPGGVYRFKALVVVGTFTSAGRRLARGVAVFDGRRWEGIGDLDGDGTGSEGAPTTFAARLLQPAAGD